MDSQKLARCKHCGGEARIQGRGYTTNDYRVYCKECGCSTLMWLTKEKAIEMWNRCAPLPDNKALTVEELREMVGAWVWVIVQYENGKCNGWALVATPAYIGFLEQTIPIDFCGQKFVAYRRPPEKED